jgi:hypothetical protein
MRPSRQRQPKRARRKSSFRRSHTCASISVSIRRCKNNERHCFGSWIIEFMYSCTFGDEVDSALYPRVQ